MLQYIYYFLFNILFLFIFIVESYMHVFGTETQLSEFNPVDSLTSRRFYLHMQEQHQLELFQHQVIFRLNTYVCI